MKLLFSMAALLVLHTATAQSTGKSNGNSVNMRSYFSVNGEKVGSLKLGEPVEIIDVYLPQNNDEYIITEEVKLYENEGTGKYVTTLAKGKAVIRETYNPDKGMYLVSYRHAKYGRLTAYLYDYNMESIGATTWYFVKTTSCASGWVLSKYIDVN